MILEVPGCASPAGHDPRRWLGFSLAERGCIALLGTKRGRKDRKRRSDRGLMHKSAGRVMFDGSDITTSSEQVVRRGLALVPQLRELFPKFSVEETLLAGSHAAPRPARHSFRQVYELFPRLAERRSQLAGSLSGGEQQMLGDWTGTGHQPKDDAARRAVGRACVGIVRAFVDAVKRIRESEWPSCWWSRIWRSRPRSPTIASCLRPGASVWRGSAREAISNEEIRPSLLP